MQMAVTVLISATLRSFTNRHARLELEGKTVEEVLQALQKACPDTENALFDEERNLRPFVNIYKNDRNITALQGLATAVSEEDELLLLPVIAGGAPTESIIPDERRKAVSLDDKEIDRYGRHLLLREISVKGQKRIKAAKVLLIGAGALGSPVALYLAAAGVGTIGIADANEVEVPDLQSQILHGTRDVNRPKAASAKDAIRKANPLVTVQTYQERCWFGIPGTIPREPSMWTKIRIARSVAKMRALWKSRISTMRNSADCGRRRLSFRWRESSRRN
jgi:adenylyltransferase/sulfurtransferase